MNRPSGFSVRIFIPSGNPEGLRIVERINGPVKGYFFPRAIFTEVRQIEDLNRTGIYVLWGLNQSGQLPIVYIGRGEAVRPRIDQHFKNRDFWTHVAIFVSRDENLNNAHSGYLESRLIQLADKASRCEMENSTNPKSPQLSEAEKVDMENFLHEILLLLPLMGVSFFDQPQSTAPGVHLFLKKGKIKAHAVYGEEGFVVLAESLIAKEEGYSLKQYLTPLRQALISKGVLVDAGEVYRLTKDYVLNSPSVAAGVVLGHSTNGSVVWKDVEGRSLAEIQRNSIDDT